MRTLLLPLILTPLLIAGCGGGGGGGGQTATPAPSPEPVPTPLPPEPTTFTISGTITAPGSQAVDSDTNDPTREAIANDTPPTAQPVPNPVTLGGYVNQPRTGATGRSFLSGDIDDFYVVDLLAGQRITVLVSDFTDADADLYLLNSDGEVIDGSLDTGQVETLLVEEPGTYFINVTAFAGATNYVLSIGNPEVATGAPLASTSLRSASAGIVPFQAVVKYKKAGELKSASLEQTLRDNFAVSRRAGERGRNQLMVIQSSQDQRLIRRRLGSGISKRAAIVDLEMRARWETLLTIKSLKAEPDIESAEPNYRVKALAVPNDEAYPLQWHYPLIGLPQAWESTTGDSNIIVAVIDSGILPDHPDLLGQLVDGYDFVRDAENAADGNGIDADPTDPGSELGGASSFHGTHVSGTVAARGDNFRGVAGVAYDARVMPLRALGFDGGTTYDVEQSIRYAAGLNNDSGIVPSQAAKIINLSLGGAPFSQSTQNLLNQVRESGIVVVAAAGNEGSIQPSYPAAYSGVISVSAVDTQRNITGYSNTGSTIDVAAPGGNSGVDLTGDGYPDGVLSTSGSVEDGNLQYVYSFLSGTSMASPHVAGVIALMMSINPELSPDDIDALLVSGALTEDLGVTGRDDQFGHGLIDANLAVIAALESIGSSPAEIPRLVASVSALNFGSSSSFLSLSLRNGGLGDLAVTDISASDEWVTVDGDRTLVTSPALPSLPPPVDPETGLGEYLVAVSRAGLETGVYATDINVSSTANTVTVRVFMSVGGENFTSDVGVLYVLLYDPETNEPLLQWVAIGDEGVYPFRFDNVEPGDYEIIAGSDADNDLLICDEGESCGAYLTIDQPARITVEGDAADLDFPAEYFVALPNIEAQADNSDAADAGGNQGLRRLPAD